MAGGSEAGLESTTGTATSATSSAPAMGQEALRLQVAPDVEQEVLDVVHGVAVAVGAGEVGAGSLGAEGLAAGAVVDGPCGVAPAVAPSVLGER